jgi:hypothetical protein
MKIKALITMLVVGSSSAAMARPVTVSGHAEWTFGTKPAPVVVRDHRTQPAPMPAPIVVRDHRTQPAPHFDCGTPAPQPVIVQPVRYNRWKHGGTYHQAPQPVMLGSELNLGEGRKFITVGESMGRFDTLQIAGGPGLIKIEQVYIQFGNNQEQVIRGIDRVLQGGQSLTLDLDGNSRTIKRIVVYGKPMFRQTFGFRAEPSTFSISAL